MTEPEHEVSATSLPPLTKDELEARVERRVKEMQAQACYRCGHPANSPEQGCACCFWAHTPLEDGTFGEAA